MRFIVKISSESFIKSRSVRTWHMKQLSRNITKVLGAIDEKVQVRSLWDRMEIDCAEENVKACQQRLLDIPGISTILTVEGAELPEENPIGFLSEKAIGYYAKSINGKSFVVRCRRTGNHDFQSVDVNRQVGSALVLNSTDSHVKMKGADVTVAIEILNNKAYFVLDRQTGLRGYPLGTQGTVLSLISGGFDSSVASYLMMKRGCRANFLFFNLGGPAHSLGAQQAALYLWQKFGSSHGSRFYSVSLDSFVAGLMQLPHTTYNGVLLKRAMLRVAEDISSRINIEALVTGESVAQVSSQTLANLSVIDRATDQLVVRPLITMDKEDIIEIAEQIGSAVFAKNMVEYCGVISKKPTVSAAFPKLEEIESAMGDDWFTDAIDSISNIAVADIINNANTNPQVELLPTVEDQTVIDIRATEKPLEQADLHIPFHQLNQKFPVLPQDKEYLLYCDKGVMSQLHAAYLHEQGFNNVKVYRPAR
uniref:tRNA sulfurtransferase n=1 Tax=uncultured Thiotrichaceae bacterium TaxID=298394 RepID=A0A6S6UBD9_9GAMM|nr:MAG: tRNA S(4)U 4-thiouridine synthase (former ThiI) / Rhodanese-like domain required for thiamine synthesis [uncultured Thiotrichaceae bacterium]